MSFLMLLGDLALYYPNDPAPDWLGMPGLTNYQAALALGIGAGFVGGQMDPLSLFYTEPRLWIDLLRATPPYGPIQSTIDLYAVNCGQVPVPFEAHFREIDLPIFYVGSEGWEGINGEYTAKQTRSRDITNLVIGSPDYPVFGHGDLFLAKNAEHLVWQPILKWLLAHR